MNPYSSLKELQFHSFSQILLRTLEIKTPTISEAVLHSVIDFHAEEMPGIHQTKHLKVRKRVKFFGKDTRNFKLVRGLCYGFMHKALCHREWKYYQLSFACRKRCQIGFWIDDGYTSCI